MQYLPLYTIDGSLRVTYMNDILFAGHILGPVNGGTPEIHAALGLTVGWFLKDKMCFSKQLKQNSSQSLCFVLDGVGKY